MDLKDRILAYMEKDAYRPLLAEDLAEGMELTNEELVEFWPAMEALEKDARIIRNRSDLYGIPSRMHLVVGRLAMSAKGFGFIIPDVRASEAETDVFVPSPMLGTAMNGDRVVARVTPSDIPGRSREGEVLRIVERANERIVGTFESSKTFGFVTPDDVKLRQDIFVNKKDFGGARTGMKVVVEITKWPSKRHNAEGRVVEVLGKAGDPGVDVLSVMRQYNLSETFPEAVRQAAEQAEKVPSPEEYRGRRDRRDLRIVTVDGDDAKDLDDGVYAEKHEDGSFFLGVYIADVSWYVRENTPLDLEARERGTSVYLVDRVIPMLPKELSNGICSLNAGEDRLSMACEMQISPEGKVTSYEILPAVIHVYRRLTYNLVNKVLVAHEQPFVDDQADILPVLKNLEELRGILKNRRQARGSIDFEIPEVKVKLDENGHPVALLKREGSLAESIIEECMLIANETVAEHMDKKHLPFLYRVHEQPSEEKIERLNSLLATFSLYVRRQEGGEISPMDVQKVLAQVAGRPEERIISTVSLRSMQQARYSEQSLGHFGLAARYYTHFTSPIRRYPDLIVHRLLRETFETGSLPLARQEKLRSILPDIAEHSSNRERIAIEAERETTDMKKIEYMAQFVGEEFSGVISGVTAFGIFVELDNGVEGLVHVSTMVNDYYAYVEEQYALIGERTRQSYRLGDEVEVLLVRANVEERNLDFVLKDNGAYDPASIRRTASGKPSPVKEREDRRDRSREERAGKKEKRGRKDRPAKGERHGRKKKLPDRELIAGPVERKKTEPQEGKHLESLDKSALKPKRKKQAVAPAKPRKKAVIGGYVVWPDQPGHQERQLQEHRQKEKAKSAKKTARRRPRPHRKTEGGTMDNK